MSTKSLLTAAALFVVAVTVLYGQLAKSSGAKKLADAVPKPTLAPGHHTELATFAGGCFWGTQAKFDEVKGVIHTIVGYTGGDTPNPTYEEVCSHTTGHAESVQVEFDPQVVSYKQLLDVFWKIHDPTEVDRQGPDVGSNYRSVIFYHSPEQKAEAEASKAEMNKTRFDGKIATEIVPAKKFYPAEEYHQHYFKKQGFVDSCFR